MGRVGGSAVDIERGVRAVVDRDADADGVGMVKAVVVAVRASMERA